MRSGLPDAGTATGMIAARRLRVTGLVQGVGFRPFVHRLALRHDIAGWALNASGSVEIHAEGDAHAIDEFVAALQQEAPVLARIESITANDTRPEGLDHFEVRASVESADARLPVSPDVALCAACRRELMDPADRRFHYPFITCTDCGPRFTVIERMPYDRERTTMRAFTQCPDCEREYRSPGHRRYHSETNSCPSCGPALWFESPDVQPLARDGDALDHAATLLRRGGILALRGLGGFHLAVDATNEGAVARLRGRKYRDAKPLAVMVASVAQARTLAALTSAESELLRSPASPIVLVTSLGREQPRGLRLAPNVHPGLDRVGLMLAYTPVHVLLLERAGVPLVMTSGNQSDEPIATGIDEARIRLSGIADGFLLHDREIVARYDDSVVRVVDESPVLVRRARGYAPLPVDLPITSPVPLLAVGPHLKNTFTILTGNRAYVSQHIGDLENVETLEHFHDARARFETLFHLRPEAVVRDLHPGYLSSRIALESGLEPVISAQHHHAHIAAVMAEHQRVEPVIGIAYDGTGYGDDGHVWGSEILYADLTGYRRLAHLRYAPLPGGDAAARAPWRSALGYQTLATDLAPFGWSGRNIDPSGVAVVRQQLARGVNTPLASSMGRLFDAAAAILGVRQMGAYEGQAAMELETLASSRPARPLPYAITSQDGGWEIDPIPLLAALGERVLAGGYVPSLAAAFHETIVTATRDVVRRIADVTGCRTVALGGGCFQNGRLLSTLRTGLRRDGFEVLVPRQLGPNDGAVSVGQALIGAARLAGPATGVTPVREFSVSRGG